MNEKEIAYFEGLGFSDLDELESMRRMYASRRDNLHLDAQYPYDPTWDVNQAVDRYSTCPQPKSPKWSAQVKPYDGSNRCVNCGARLSLI